MSKNINFYKDYSTEILRTRIINGLRWTLFALLPVIFIMGYLRQEKDTKSVANEQAQLTEKVKVERDLIEALSKQPKPEVKGESDINVENLQNSLALIKRNLKGDFWGALHKIVSLPAGAKGRLVAVEFSDVGLLIHGEAVNALTADQIATFVSISAKESGYWQVNSRQIVEKSDGIFDFKLFLSTMVPDSELTRGKHE